MHAAHKIVDRLLESDFADDEGALEDFFQAIGGEPTVKETDEFKSTLFPDGTEILEYVDGTRAWLLNGDLHREDGPAVVRPDDGRQEWWTHGKCHREDGPAIESVDGTKVWCVNGQRHREEGPAIELPDGTREWWLNNKRHREDGPAMEWADGTVLWYLNGEALSQEEHARRTGRQA